MTEPVVVAQTYAHWRATTLGNITERVETNVVFELRMIGGSAPSKYLAQLQGHVQVKLDDAAMDTILKSHVIDPALLRADSFQAFYAARKAALLALVERAMGKASAEATAIVADDEEGDEEEGEAA